MSRSFRRPFVILVAGIKITRVFLIVWAVLFMSGVATAQGGSGEQEPSDDVPANGEEAKGQQDLQMIAKRMEFLSSQLNRMPTPPRLDATLIIQPEEEMVLGKGNRSREPHRDKG